MFTQYYALLRESRQYCKKLTDYGFSLSVLMLAPKTFVWKTATAIERAHIS